MRTEADGVAFLSGRLPTNIDYRIRVVANGYETIERAFDPLYWTESDLTFYLDRKSLGRTVVDGVITGGGGKDTGPFIINVTVRENLRGRPLSGANVAWYRGITTVDERPTSPDGSIRLSSGADVGRYLYTDNTIEVKASGYSRGRLDNFGFSEGGRTLNIQFILRPD